MWTVRRWIPGNPSGPGGLFFFKPELLHSKLFTVSVTPCSTLTVCSEELHYSKIHCSQINSRSRCYRFVRACRENVRILRCISVRNTRFKTLLHASPVTAVTLRNPIQHLGGWMSSTFWFWVSFGWITELKWQFLQLSIYRHQPKWGSSCSAGRAACSLVAGMLIYWLLSNGPWARHVSRLLTLT